MKIIPTYALTPFTFTLYVWRKIRTNLNATINTVILFKNSLPVGKCKIHGIIHISNKGIINFGNNIVIRSGVKENNLGEGFITRLITKGGAAHHR